MTTLHRPANVDAGDAFLRLLAAIGEGTRGMPVVFPVHPRTAKTLRELGSGEGSGGSGSGSRGSEGGSRGSGRGSALPANLCLVDPQPYLEFNWLVKHARAVITDSGGITEETTVMGVPCLTLRDTTERPETITLGTNELIGTDPSRLKPALDRLFAGQWKKGAVPPLWDGRTGERIVGVLEGLAVDGRLGTLSVPG